MYTAVSALATRRVSRLCKADKKLGKATFWKNYGYKKLVALPILLCPPYKGGIRFSKAETADYNYKQKN